MLNNRELNVAATNLVLRILNRGRLQQQEIEGKLKVRDMGINAAKEHFVDLIKRLAETEAIALADKIIGKTVHDNPAVSKFQSEQRIKLAEYQAPKRTVRIEVRAPAISMRNNYKKLDGVPGTDQLSENEG